jgi:thioredoxin-like negative regulator of GroEL
MSTRTAGDASGNGDGESTGLLSVWGDLDGAEQILRARADGGNESAVSRLAELLARADADDRDAATELAELLEERGHLDEALQILRARANVGDWDAARRLRDLGRQHGV